MADPVGFEGANLLLSGEKLGCSDLECFTNGEQVISAWRLTDEEMKQVAETGIIWLSVWGVTAPPVMVSGEALVEISGKPAKVEPVIPKRKPD